MPEGTELKPAAQNSNFSGAVQGLEDGKAVKTALEVQGEAVAYKLLSDTMADRKYAPDPQGGPSNDARAYGQTISQTSPLGSLAIEFLKDKGPKTDKEVVTKASLTKEVNDSKADMSPEGTLRRKFLNQVISKFDDFAKAGDQDATSISFKDINSLIATERAAAEAKRKK